MTTTKTINGLSAWPMVCLPKCAQRFGRVRRQPGCRQAPFTNVTPRRCLAQNLRSAKARSHLVRCS